MGNQKALPWAQAAQSVYNQLHTVTNTAEKNAGSIHGLDKELAELRVELRAMKEHAVPTKRVSAVEGSLQSLQDWKEAHRESDKEDRARSYGLRDLIIAGLIPVVLYYLIELLRWASSRPLPDLGGVLGG